MKTFLLILLSLGLSLSSVSGQSLRKQIKRNVKQVGRTIDPRRVMDNRVEQRDPHAFIPTQSENEDSHDVTPRFGYTEDVGVQGGQAFEQILPRGAEIRQINVTYDSYNSPRIVGLEIMYVGTDRHQRKLKMGGIYGTTSRHEVPRGVQLTAISGIAYTNLEAIQFHFSDGSSSRVMGNSSGQANFHLEVPSHAVIAGFFGSEDRDIKRLGLIWHPK